MGVPCWSTTGCSAVQCQGLKVCWAGHTFQVVIMKCWAVRCWLLTCWVGNFFWIIHNDWLVNSCWPITCWPIICWVVICWAVTCRAIICWPIHNLCWTRHCCWVVHFSCRFFHVFWPGRRRNHRYDSSLWWLGKGRGQLYFPSGDVGWTRPLSTLSSSLLMMTRRWLAIGRCPRWWWWQGPAITRWLMMMVMGMRGRGWRLGVRRPGNTVGPWTTSRIRLSPWAGPARRRGSGPLTLSTSTVVSRRMVSGGVLASVGPVRSSLAIPTSWSVAFWPVGAGPSHHRYAGSHRLLGFTGPGRPDGRLLHLRSLRPRTWLSWLSWTWTTRRPYAWQEVEGPLLEHVSQLSRPSSHALGTYLPLLTLQPPYVCASVRWLSLVPARPLAANPYRSHRANLQYTKWEPRLVGIVGIDSGCH